jgi:hypothetical protein
VAPTPGTPVAELQLNEPAAWDFNAVASSIHDERVVDVMEELVKFKLLTRDVAPYPVDRYSERRESAEELSKRVNLRSILEAIFIFLAATAFESFIPTLAQLSHPHRSPLRRRMHSG